MMRRLTLAEVGESQRAPLSDAEAAILVSTGLAETARTETNGVWQVRAGRKVGTLQIGQTLQVTVTPKVEIDRLVFMMGYARAPSFWRDDPVALPRHEDLPEALAHAFNRFATKSVEQGLLQGYREVDDSLHVVRGRIRADDQLRLRYQMPLPVEVRYDEFTVDIAENQILLDATMRLLRVPQISTVTRSGLHRLRLQFNDVTRLGPGRPLPAWRESRLNARYQLALRIAELVIAASSFDQLGNGGEIEVTGFIFDAWKIFEDFVCVALSEAMTGGTGQAKFQHRGWLDTGGAIPIEPDFTWWSGSQPRAVVDAKYKVEKIGRFPNADAYQVLAYCTALGLDDGHLVYAKGEADQRSYRVTRSPVTIHCHTLDLATEPGRLLEQVRALASRIAPGHSMLTVAGNEAARPASATAKLPIDTRPL